MESIVPLGQVNYTINIQHKAINISEIIASNNLTTGRMDVVKNISWCHDLQGSDFIYTPTLYSSTVRHVIAMAFILVMIVTVIGNAIVIIIVVTDRPLRRITSSLVLSMATADILVAMCGELQSIIMMLSTDAWALSDLLCEIFTSADLYFSLSGLLHIVCLAGDRYLAICYPFKYERWCQKYMILSIVTSWTLPLGFSFLPIMGHWYRIGLEDLYVCLHQLEVHTCTLFPNKGFSTISFVAMFALPSALMCYCYAHIYRVAMAQRKRMSSLRLGVYCDVGDLYLVRQVPMTYSAPHQTHFNGVSNDVHINGVSNDVHANGVSNDVHANNVPADVHTNGLSTDVHINGASSVARENFASSSEPHVNGVAQVHLNGASNQIQNSYTSTQAHTNGGTRKVRKVPKSQYEEAVFISHTKTDLHPYSNSNIEYLRGGRRMQRRQSHKGKQRSTKRHRLGFLGEDFRAARVISIVFLCFTITWSPYWFTILIMPYVGPNEIPDAIIGAGLWLAYFGSALNPFVYYFNNNAVKKGIRRLIIKVLHRLGHHNHRHSNSFS